MKAKKTLRKTTKKMAKKGMKKSFQKKILKKSIAELPLPENDEDLRMILNKGDFDKYELDAYLNELG